MIEIEPLFSLADPKQARIIKRPSSVCKSPYVADAELVNLYTPIGAIFTFETNKTNTILHCPSLGCCGLCEKGSIVFVEKLDKKGVCEYKSVCSIIKEKENILVIGIYPKYAERIAERCLATNQLPFLKNLLEFEREKTFLNSRFDFAGRDKDGRQFIMEIKNVPLADYVILPKKERDKLKNRGDNKEYDKKTAYFPDGYRKTSKDVVSPRALKHIEELEKIKMENPDVRTILCFIIQRHDILDFKLSPFDVIYNNAINKARHNGVEIYACSFNWTLTGDVFMHNNNVNIIYD